MENSWSGLEPNKTQVRLDRKEEHPHQRLSEMFLAPCTESSQLSCSRKRQSSTTHPHWGCPSSTHFPNYSLSTSPCWETLILPRRLWAEEGRPSSHQVGLVQFTVIKLLCFLLQPPGWTAFPSQFQLHPCKSSPVLLYPLSSPGEPTTQFLAVAAMQLNCLLTRHYRASGSRDPARAFPSAFLPQLRPPLRACVAVRRRGGGAAVMAALVRDPLAARTRLWPLPAAGGDCSVRGLLRHRARELNIPEESLYVKCNGRLASDEDVLQNGAVYSLEPRLCGGKGGFGSMLRALGAQIEKTTNREACRDLSGRRLRDVNHEKAMAEWVKQQAEREAEKEQRRLERLQRKLVEPKHFFTNPDYQQQCHEMAERLEDSVLKGLQASSSKMVSPESSSIRKRPGEPGENGTKPRKRKCFWLGLEGLDDCDSSDSEDDSEDDSPHASDGGCPSGSRCDENAGNSSACSSSSVEPAEDSPATSATEKPLEQPECSGRDLQGETSTSGQPEIPAEGNSTMTKPLKEEAQEKNEVAQAPKEEEQESVSPKAQETNQLQSTEVEPIDLMMFNSAAEMEALGLDKLKMGLMSLGLKCGGTLKERAARLFSVRGLSRDQIDPALFAKPSKGKKK